MPKWQTVIGGGSAFVFLAYLAVDALEKGKDAMGVAAICGIVALAVVHAEHVLFHTKSTNEDSEEPPK